MNSYLSNIKNAGLHFLKIANTHDHTGCGDYTPRSPHYLKLQSKRNYL
jgi:hypothetical protein